MVHFESGRDGLAQGREVPMITDTACWPDPRCAGKGELHGSRTSFQRPEQITAADRLDVQELEGGNHCEGDRGPGRVSGLASRIHGRDKSGSSKTMTGPAGAGAMPAGMLSKNRDKGSAIRLPFAFRQTSTV